jgi:hypothetical protein
MISGRSIRHSTSHRGGEVGAPFGADRFRVRAEADFAGGCSGTIVTPFGILASFD